MFEGPRDLLVFLARYDETVQALALNVRDVVARELAPCHEYIFEMRSKVVLLYGASARVISDGICSVGVFTFRSRCSSRCWSHVRPRRKPDQSSHSQGR